MIQKFIQLNLFLNINNLYLQSQYLGGFGQERALTKFKWLNCQSLVGSMVRIPGPEHNNKSADFFICCWSRLEGGKKGGKIQMCS